MGNNIIKDWKPRWISLHNDKLEYFRSKLDSSPAGSISLISAHVKKSTIRPNCIEIVTPTRSYWFTATTEEESVEWGLAITSTSRMLTDTYLSEYNSNGKLPSYYIEFQGYLHKQSKKDLKTFHQRWAVISNETLVYYENEKVYSITFL